MPTDTKLNQLIINQLTQEQYDEAKAAGTLSDTELYITDSDDDAQVKSNLSQTIDDSTTKYPSNKAVKDESNRITTLMDTKVSNCITEIPQDIKLELNNGTLTLKAGSKVYVPNGFESDGTTKKFDMITIESDKVWSSRNLDYPQQFVFLKPSKEFEAVGESGGTIHSGTTAPSGKQFMLWYDTTTNFIKWTNDSGATWVSGNSLPLSICSSTKTNNWTSIDQVFNGFGYISSTVYALPGIKGLIPNGRNADGSLKSIEFTLDKVLTATRDWTVNNQANQHIRLGLNDLFFANGYVDSLVMPTVNNYILWYNPRDNIMRYNNTNNNVTSIADYPIVEWMELGATGVGDNTSRITNFTPKTVFHALDYNDKSTISGWSMPSSRYIDLTLGASGSTYTAPANGWFCVAKRSGGTNQYLGLISYGLEFTDYYNSNLVARNFIPCKKGGNITVNYNMTGNTEYFRFIYAEGDKPSNVVRSSSTGSSGSDKKPGGIESGGIESGGGFDDIL